MIIILIALTGCSPELVDMSESINTYQKNNGRQICSFFDLEINGCMQKVLIESKDTINNPVLLYLHGGPGSSALIYSHIYSDKLRDNFIFVNWDQRGTAYSYHEGMDPSEMSEEQIRDDALELTLYLLKRFNKKKIFLAGHSFGSVLGLQLAANHPELFFAYIGIGQVIPSKWDESVKITYNWLHGELIKNNDLEGLKRIEKDHFPYIDLVTKYGGHHRLSINLETLKRTSPYYFNGYDEMAERGRDFSQGNVCEGRSIGNLFYKLDYKIKSMVNRSIYRIDIPLFFFEGENDHVIACAPELVVEYCNMARAPKKEIVWFHDSAHMMNIEEPEKFQNELIRIKKETIRE